MQDELYAYVRKHDYEHYVAALLTKDAAQRHHVMAVLAFAQEIKHISHVTREPMTAYIRLAWWRERIEDIYNGKEAPEQMTLRALKFFIVEYAPPKEWFLQIIESGGALQEGDPLEAHAEIGESVAMLMAWAVQKNIPESAVKKVGRVDGMLQKLRGARNELPEHFIENLENQNRDIKINDLNPCPTLAFIQTLSVIKTKKYKGLMASHPAQPVAAIKMRFLPLRALMFNLLTLK
ncbi:MAG: squalene/phytoene synthase family protein [Rickettsiales bacterium]